jgi:germacradienol/geosmin synthase
MLGWCRAMGMLAALPGPIPVGVWDETRLAGDDFALWAAATDPETDLAALSLASQWLAWRAYADDALARILGAAWNLPAARRLADRLAQFMPVDGAQLAVPTNPIERGLADLWDRTRARMARAGRDLLRAAVLSLAGGWAWELANQAYNRVADPVDYLETRRSTSGSAIQLALIVAPVIDQVPADLIAARPVRSVTAAAQDVVGLVNDVFSFQKEIEYEGDLNNGVLVMQTLLDCGRPQAAAITANLASARVREFEHVLALELPPLLEDVHLDQRGRDCLTEAIRRLESWMSGTRYWHEMTGRYRQPSLMTSLTSCRRMARPFPMGASRGCPWARMGAGPMPVGIGSHD